MTTPEPLRDPPRLPFGRLLLMPWRWGRWALGAMGICVSLFPFAYFLSAVPVVYVWAMITGASPENEDWFGIVYGPAIIVHQSSKLAEAAIDWEIETCEAIFGPLP